ncbi:MAG: GyrI-like domain-containing protein [Bacteroidales bacterium]|nr:GyrI-like domain-containing protein [Bacteroidales bacterium]
MSRTVEKRYCQSCGMPLRFDVEAYLGTNTDQSYSDEYYYYCLKDGEYTVDIPMEQMVDIWVKYTDKYNGYSGTNYTPQELRTLLNKRLPTLNRWRQKEETRNIHYETVSRIKTYIDQNLFEDLDPEQLAVLSHLSFFHFRRVFRNITGENIGAYIQRLRLEYVAHLLIATRQSLEEILKQTNYQTRFSLAKAFKKHFGISMSDYRHKYSLSKNSFAAIPLQDVRIKRISTRKALCLQVGDSFRDEKTYKLIWQKLLHYRNNHLQQDLQSHFVSISRDNPWVTPDLQCRFYIGFITKEEIKPEGNFSIEEIAGGMYAVFTHKGSYSLLPDLYQAIYEQWLPQNKYFQKYPLTFEIYLNVPSDTQLDELLTEIYIPIEKL